MNRLAILHQQLKKVIGGRSLPFLSIAGQVFTIKDGENDQNVSSLDKESKLLYVDVHVIDASPYMSKIYYPGKFDPDADPVAPTCYSNDGFKPASDVATPQCDLCAQCPHNAWGSRVTELGNKGKACNDAWKVAVIVPEHHDEKVIMMRVPPASLQNWLAYIAQFNDLDYPGEDRKMNAADVITRVYFEGGKNGILNFLPLNFLDPTQDEDVARIIHARDMVESGKTEMYIGVDNVAPEKKEEMLALSAPSNAPQLTHQPTAVKPKLVAKQAPVIEEAEEVEEEEERPVAQAKPSPKAFNTVLSSEMRTVKKPVMGVMKKPAATASNGKPPVSEGMKGVLSNIMKMK